MSSKKLSIGLVAAIAVAAGSFGVFRATAGSTSTPPDRALETTPAGEVTTLARQQVNGTEWSLSSFKNQNGRLCLQQNLTAGTAGSGTACTDPNTVFARGPLHAEVDQNNQAGDKNAWSTIWVYGWSAPQVAKIMAMTETCQAVPVPVSPGGVFSHVFAGNLIPIRLLAYASDGSQLQDTALHITQGPTADTPAVSNCP